MSVIMNYYRYINRELIQFDFIYFKEFSENTYECEIKKLGGRCHLISTPSLSSKYRKEISRFFESHYGEYDILHNHELYLTFLFANVAKKNGIKKVVGHAHTTKFSDRLIASCRNRVLCLPVNKLCDYRFACSAEAGRIYYGKQNMGYSFSILNNAIECEKFYFDESCRNALRSKLGLRNEDIIIGNVGRFCPQKNQKFIIDIFSGCLKVNNNYKLLFVGDGPMEEEVRQMVIKYGLDDRIVFLGRREDVNQLYNCMDIFLLPSLFEGLGIVLIEAQANGLPCITSDVVPKEAKITEYYYTLNLKDSAVEWASLINSIKIKRNTYAQKDLGKSSFTIKSQAIQLEAVYAKLVDG